MRFIVFCLLLFAAACICFGITGTAHASSEVTLVASTSDDTDADEKADACARRFAGCGVFRRIFRPLRVRRSLRVLRPFRGRCELCG